MPFTRQSLRSIMHQPSPRKCSQQSVAGVISNPQVKLLFGSPGYPRMFKRPHWDVATVFVTLTPLL